jgi:hypothetical protein
MKTLFALLILAIPSLSMAQETGEFIYGPHITIGNSTLKGNSNTETQVSFGGGVLGQYQASKYFGLMAGADFMLKGGKITGTQTPKNSGPFSNPDDFTQSVRFANLELPLMAYVSFDLGNLKLKPFTGISFNFPVLAYYDLEYKSQTEYNESKTEISSTQSMTNAFLWGLRLDVKGKDGLYSLFFKQSKDLSNALTIDGKGYRNQYFSIGLGYSF